MSEPEIPKQHKAMVYDQPGKPSVKLTTVDTPEPGPGEVLIHLTHSGVCHSDWSIMMNGWTASYIPYDIQPGQVGGHEGVGTIVKLGVGAEAFGRKIGERVGIKWIAGTCMTCEYCIEGFEAGCGGMKISGYYTPGTFQEYAVSSANYVTPIPDGLDSAAAAPMLCAGVTVYSAIKRSNTKPGQFLVIAGAGGGLGHLAVQIAAKGMGLRVIGIDVGSKRDFVLGLGAEHFFDLKAHSPEELVKAVIEATSTPSYPGEGAHGIVVCSGVIAAYESAILMLRKGGTLVAVGMPEGEPNGVKGISPTMMVAKSHKFVGSAVGNRSDAIEILDMAARGIVKTSFSVEPMEKLPEIFDKIDKGVLNGRVVVECK